MRRRTLLAATVPAALAARGVGARAQVATPIATETDVAYGEAGGRQLLLDVHRPPDRAASRPAVLLFHGGAWTYGISGRQDMAQPAAELAAAGYVAFNVEYRLTGDPVGAHRWPDQLDDAQRAVRWVRANADRYGVDPARVGAYGHSAGGHLAASLGVRDTRAEDDPALAGIPSRVSAVVALAGHFDLALPYPQEFDRQSLVALLGGAPEEAPAAYRDASPRTWLSADAAPFLIAHGGADDMNLPAHARQMATAIAEAGGEVVYAEFPAADHFTVADWAVSGPWTLTFFGVHLRPDR